MDTKVEGVPPNVATQNNESHQYFSHISTDSSIDLANNDLTVTVHVSICNQPVKMLIDCGAHATMIKASRLRSNILYYPQVKYCLTGISGPDNPVKTHGATYGNIIFNSIKLKQQMQIAGEDLYLNYDGIIGIDFLRQYNATLCLRSLSIRLLLPPWHELYEAQEREEFEKNGFSLHKKIESNELIYIHKHKNQPIETRGKAS